MTAVLALGETPQTARYGTHDPEAVEAFLVRYPFLIPVLTDALGPLEAAQLRLLLNTGVSVLVVALLWDDENADTMGTAAALGCQVVGLHPGQDLSSALSRDIGAGSR